MKDYDGITSAKIATLIEYFDSEERVDKTNPRFARAVKLQKMMDIYYSDLLELEKISRMNGLYKKAADFKKQFSDLENYSSERVISHLSKITKMISDYYTEAEEKGLVDRAKELKDLENSHYYDDYHYACYFINEYNNFESPYISDFLNAYNLKSLQFDRFLDIVRTLNDKLYEEYLTKSEEKRNLRKLETIEKVKNLSNITKYQYNSEIDAVEFYKNLPFYDQDSANEILEDFGARKASTMDIRFKMLLDMIPSSAVNISRIYENNLSFGNKASMISEKEIHEMGCIIDGRLVTEEEKDIIIKYMKDNKIPFLFKAFAAVRNKYLKEELEKEENKLIK